MSEGVKVPGAVNARFSINEAHNELTGACAEIARLAEPVADSHGSTFIAILRQPFEGGSRLAMTTNAVDPNVVVGVLLDALKTAGRPELSQLVRDELTRRGRPA